MKKALAFTITAILLVALVVSLAIPATAEKLPDTVYNLIPEDAEITKIEANGVEASATFDENGVLTVQAAGLWPSVKLTYAEPYTFNIADATLKVKFTLTSGGTSFRIQTSESVDTQSINEIFPHHFIEGMTFDAAGDLATPGTYEFEIPFSELAFCDWTAEAVYQGKIPFTTDELTLTSILIFSVGGAQVIVEKLEVVVEGEDIIDISEETSEATSEATSEEPIDESSEETSGTTPTGDSGLIALAIVSVLSLAGAVIIKKK